MIKETNPCFHELALTTPAEAGARGLKAVSHFCYNANINLPTACPAAGLSNYAREALSGQPQGAP